MSRLLQYVEAPPYLRKKLFPVHRDLKFAGLMPPVDAPHHMQHKDDRSMYREGIVTDKPAGEGRCEPSVLIYLQLMRCDALLSCTSYLRHNCSSPLLCLITISFTRCWVDIGTSEDVRIDHPLRPGIRVTIKLTETSKDHSSSSSTGYQCQAVSPNEPRETYGLYWGYQTRLVRSFSEIFSSCPFASPSSDGSYDFTIGHTTNRGKTASLTKEGTVLQPLDMPTYTFPDTTSAGDSSGGGKLKSGKDEDCRHYLLVFGGAQGLEGCVEADESLSTIAANTDTLFDVYWNALPSNGTRAVRTEEELLVSLSKISAIIRRGQSQGLGRGRGTSDGSDDDEEEGTAGGNKKKRKA